MGTGILSDYVTREQLAEELNITKRTLDKWHFLRYGPPKIKIGAYCYYNRGDVSAWIDSLRKESVSAND